LFDLSTERYAFDADGDKEAPPFHQWAEGTILDGKPFTWHKHEYMMTPYRDMHPYQVEIKATQIGNTSKALLRVVYSGRYMGYRGILYYFPNKVDVSDFSRARLNSVIADNPETIGKWIKHTDSVNLKQIWNSFLYLRGLNSRVGVKSVPADFLVVDELDEAPQNAVYMATKRMSHSEFKHVLYMSNPTLPDYGIDLQFQSTDQRYYLLKCPKCGEFTCLEDTFPNCLHQRPNGEVVRICQSCKDGILDPAVGEWVAKKPSITDRRGYHYSQLFSWYVSPEEILKEYLNPNTNVTEFMNLVIGNAYVEAQNRLSVEEVLALCGSNAISYYSTKPCFMGVDQGKDLHVVIGRKHPAKEQELVHMNVYRDFEELDRLMKMFNVSLCVIDAMPETRKAMEFAQRHCSSGGRPRVYLNYYAERQKVPVVWNEGSLTVTSQRTYSLDASHRQITGGLVVLPQKNEEVEAFAKHLHNVAKKLEEEEDDNGNKTGNKRYVYVKLGEDHYRHAFNYEVLAQQNAPEWMFPELQ
jgi:hypothetical protein